MKDIPRTLWLLLLSQMLLLVSSLIEPPTGWLMITLRVGVPLIVIVYIGLMLGGFIRPGKQ